MRLRDQLNFRKAARVLKVARAEAACDDLKPRREAKAEKDKAKGGKE